MKFNLKFVMTGVIWRKGLHCSTIASPGSSRVLKKPLSAQTCLLNVGDEAQRLCHGKIYFGQMVPSRSAMMVPCRSAHSLHGTSHLALPKHQLGKSCLQQSTHPGNCQHSFGTSDWSFHNLPSDALCQLWQQRSTLCASHIRRTS